MDINPGQVKLPVLMLYNLDPDWRPEEIVEARQTVQTLAGALRGEGQRVTELCLEDQDLVGLLRPYNPDDFVVFNFCEEIPGIPHSYDLIAYTLEELGFAFTGADSKALSVSQDKRKVKQLLDSCGIETPRWHIFHAASSDSWTTYPAIVKPALEHCSLGLTRDSVVCSAAELTSRIGYVIESYRGPALVEEFIDGREYSVSVIGNEVLHVLPVVEIDFSAFNDIKDRLCTYECKFVPHSKAYNLTKYLYPATLTEDEGKLLKQTIERSYRAADCRDYARIDCRLRDGIVYILDVNANADLTPGYGIVFAAELAGISCGKLTSLLIHYASQRHPKYGNTIGDELRLESVS